MTHLRRRITKSYCRYASFVSISLLCLHVIRSNPPPVLVTAFTCHRVFNTKDNNLRFQPCRKYSLLCLDKQDANVEVTSEVDTAKVFGFPKETVAAPLALLLLSQFILFIGVGAVIPSIPLYGKEIGLSSAGNGVVISAPAVALLIGAKFAGNFADAARKPAMMIGMAIITVSDIGTAFANGIGTLVLARFGLGAGRCISESGERGLLADLAGKVPEMRGRALAAQQAVVALGIAIGAPIGGIIVEEYGPRASFLCVSAGAFVALVMYAFLPETILSNDEKTQTKRDGDDKTAAVESALLAPAEAVEVKETSVSQGEWSILLSKRQWKGLALCQSGASFGFAAKIACIPILASSVLPGGAVGAGALLSLAGLSGLVGAPFGGWLADIAGSSFTVVFSGLVSATGLMLIPLALSPSFNEAAADVNIPFLDVTMGFQAIAFSLLVLTWSLGASAQGPALTAKAQELAPEGAEATALALPRASGDGTYIIAPFLLGLVTDSASSVPGAECTVAGIMTLIGVIAFSLCLEDDNII